MSNELAARANRDSDVLALELSNLKKTPLLQRGEAAVRLAALTVAALARLEARIDTLEAYQHGAQS